VPAESFHFSAPLLDAVFNAMREWLEGVPRRIDQAQDGDEKGNGCHQIRAPSYGQHIGASQLVPRGLFLKQVFLGGLSLLGIPGAPPIMSRISISVRRSNSRTKFSRFSTGMGEHYQGAMAVATRPTPEGMIACCEERYALRGVCFGQRPFCFRLRG
jgi:hypothetical protein